MGGDRGPARGLFERHAHQRPHAQHNTPTSDDYDNTVADADADAVDPTTALPFFFPETAYLQVKAIADPSADYQNRLINWYRLDIAAAHALLGGQASSATFVRVTVPTAQAVWIVPGVVHLGPSTRSTNRGIVYNPIG